MKPNLLGKKIAFYVLIVVVWQGIDSAEIWPDNIFPSPIEVGEDLLYGISATYIGFPVNAASEIIEVESHVTATYFARERADKYAFLSMLSIIKLFVLNLFLQSSIIFFGVLIDGITIP